MTRTSGLFIMAPILGHTSFPRTAKVGLLIMLSGLVVSTLPDQNVPVFTSFYDLVGIIAQELFIGILIGLFFMLLFYGAQSAGSLVGYQMALAMAAAVDPSTKSQESIIGRFWFLLASLIFLAINGHHLIVRALHNSFYVIPPGTVSLSGDLGEVIGRGR